MSTELAILEPEYLEVFAPEDTNSDIEALLDSISNHELRLATSYVRLGVLLLKAQNTRSWNGYPSFAQYLGYIENRIGRARSQIYAYVSVAEHLLPHVSESDLEKMGISRASELARFVKQSGRGVPSHLLAAALDTKQFKIDKLHTEVLEELHERGEVRGKWHDPLGGGFYATDEEMKEIKLALDSARNMNPTDQPEHVQRKEIFLALCREFISSNPA